MLNNAGFVYYIVENNPIHPNTIIENKTMDRNGVSITHVSMAKGTTMSPERFNTIALYSVEKGKLDIEIRGEVRKSVVLEPGQFWLRAAHALVGFEAVEDTVFTQVVLHRASEISRSLLDHETVVVKDLLDYGEKPQTMNLIRDKWMGLELCSVAPGQNIRVDAEKNQIVVLGILDGNGGLTAGDRNMKIGKYQTFGIEADHHVRLLCASGMKVLITRLIEQGNRKVTK